MKNKESQKKTSCHVWYQTHTTLFLLSLEKQNSSGAFILTPLAIFIYKTSRKLYWLCIYLFHVIYQLFQLNKVISRHDITSWLWLSRVFLFFNQKKEKLCCFHIICMSVCKSFGRNSVIWMFLGLQGKGQWYLTPSGNFDSMKGCTWSATTLS